jgi:hypothetical protein
MAVSYNIQLTTNYYHSFIFAFPHVQFNASLYHSLSRKHLNAAPTLQQCGQYESTLYETNLGRYTHRFIAIEFILINWFVTARPPIGQCRQAHPSLSVNGYADFYYNKTHAEDNARYPCHQVWGGPQRPSGTTPWPDFH